MPLAALSKNLWKRFIEVKDSSRQFDSIIRYGHPESTLICFYPLEAELSPLSFLPLFLMKKSKATCQSFMSLLVLWHFPSEDFSLHHKPGKNTHLLLLLLHLVLTNPKQDNAIFFQARHTGTLDAEQSITGDWGQSQSEHIPAAQGEHRLVSQLLLLSLSQLTCTSLRGSSAPKRC